MLLREMLNYERPPLAKNLFTPHRRWQHLLRMTDNKGYCCNKNFQKQI